MGHVKSRFVGPYRIPIRQINKNNKPKMKTKLIFAFALLAVFTLVMCSGASAEKVVMKGKGMVDANGTGIAVVSGFGRLSVDGTGDILVKGRNPRINMQGFNCSRIGPFKTKCEGNGYGNITVKPGKMNIARVVFNGTVNDFQAAGKGRVMFSGSWDYATKPLHLNATAGNATPRKCLREERWECMANATLNASNLRSALRNCSREARIDCLANASLNKTGSKLSVLECIREKRAGCNAQVNAAGGKFELRRCLREARAECLPGA